jgi:hypothetical protein
VGRGGSDGTKGLGAERMDGRGSCPRSFNAGRLEKSWRAEVDVEVEEPEGRSWFAWRDGVWLVYTWDSLVKNPPCHRFCRFLAPGRPQLSRSTGIRGSTLRSWSRDFCGTAVSIPGTDLQPPPISAWFIGGILPSRACCDFANVPSPHFKADPAANFKSKWRETRTGNPATWQVSSSRDADGWVLSAQMTRFRGSVSQNVDRSRPGKFRHAGGRIDLYPSTQTLAN